MLSCRWQGGETAFLKLSFVFYVYYIRFLLFPLLNGACMSEDEPRRLMLPCSKFEDEDVGREFGFDTAVPPMENNGAAAFAAAVDPGGRGGG